MRHIKAELSVVLSTIDEGFTDVRFHCENLFTLEKFLSVKEDRQNRIHVVKVLILFVKIVQDISS